MARYPLLALFALGCSGAPTTEEPGSQPVTPATGGTVAQGGSLQHMGGSAGEGGAPAARGGMGGSGGATAEPEPEPEPDPGPPGYGDPCEVTSECEVEGAPEHAQLCWQGKCTFRCDRLDGWDYPAVPSLVALCEDYGSVCAGELAGARLVCR